MILLYDMLIELFKIVFVATWMIGIYFLTFLPLNYLFLLINQDGIIIGDYEYLFASYVAGLISGGAAILSFKYFEKLRDFLNSKFIGSL